MLQSPENVVQCRITGEANAAQFFFINSQTCIITLSTSVLNTGVNFYRVSTIVKIFKSICVKLSGEIRY